MTAPRPLWVRIVVELGPLVLLLAAYDSLRSIAPLVNHRVHFTEMVRFDRSLTGGDIPTYYLQKWLYHGHLNWYDFYFYALYMLHFIIPLILAVLIWRYRPYLYRRYMIAFLLLSYAAFMTYLAFPAAPPWMASEMHLITQIHKISTDVWWALGVRDITAFYKTISPNLVAAVPSLHAAYPTMILLFITRAFGWRWGLALAWYPASIWLGVVYMGEHYVFDVLLGISYAVIAFVVTEWAFKRYTVGLTARTSKLSQQVS